MRLAEHIDAIHRVCFLPEPPEEDLLLLGERERWLVYRRMVRVRLVEVIEAALPRTKAELGTAFDDAIDDWLSQGGPELRYFRQVPDDFAAWAVPRWKEQHAAHGELAEYEIACWAVKHGNPAPSDAAAFVFDLPPMMNPALRVLRLEYPVHLDATPTDPESTCLCVYRSAEHRPVTWKLNPLAADLIEAWIPGDRTVAETVQAVAAKHGTEIGPAFVEKLSGMIADFLERGILLGSKPA